jgi:CelD/BcsL family acetyltransferase involved in cellulose biosynthesis
MRARLTPLSDLTPRELSAWRELADDALEPDPFHHPDFVLPAATALAGDRVALLVAETGEGWAGCLPVHPGSWRGWRVPALASWSHPYCFLTTPLIRVEDGARTLGAMVDHALASTGTGMLLLESMGWTDRVSTALERAMSDRAVVPQHYRSHTRAALRRRGEEDYHAGMRAHHRRELRRLRRRLEQATGAELRVADRSADPRAYDEFVALEREGWKGRAGTALGSSPGHAAFFRAVCERFAAAGRLELLALAAGDRPLAMKCNLRAGEGVFCFKIAFDERFARYSPGVQSELENVERFHSGEAAWMDSCADADNGMINRLWPDRRRISSVLLPGRSLLGRVTRSGARVVQALQAQERRRAPACS